MIRNVLVAVIMLTLVLAALSLWRQLDRPVRAVRVEGALSAAEQAAIRHVVSANLGSGVLSLDTAKLGEKIHELSWPRSVAVRRVWPDTLVIRVEKESVVAAWGDGGYLTSAGKIVQLADGARAVPELAASLSEPKRAMEVYQMLESRVNRAGFSIVRLEENRLGEWALTFERGMTVALGSESLTERLERFLFAYRAALSQRAGEIAHVDLRYHNGLAVRWAEPTAGGATAAASVAASVGATSWSRMEDSGRSRPGGRSHNGGGRSHNGGGRSYEEQRAEYALRE